MAYWLTMHWPRPEGTPRSEPYYGVWAKDGKWPIIEQLAPGDLVLVYESVSGKTPLRAGGRQPLYRRQRGRGGIVALLQVTERAAQSPDTQPEHYTDRTRAWWRYCAPTISLDSGGYVPLVQVNRILGNKEAYNLHGYGEAGSGIKRLSKEKFDSILAAYRAWGEAADAERATQRLGHATFGGTGEGPEHRALKERIANDPAGVLGEAGLTLWQMEWPLPTNDRIDVVLKDSFNRFVAVEVEVDCGAEEVIGPLQSMKYRALIAYAMERPVEEVRAMLVAYTIHSDVIERCFNYRIETHEVARRPDAATATNA